MLPVVLHLGEQVGTVTAATLTVGYAVAAASRHPAAGGFEGVFIFCLVFCVLLFALSLKLPESGREARSS